MIQIVTTMNERIYHQTGRRMIESVRENWSGVMSAPMMLYAEGFWPAEAAYGASLLSLPEWCHTFKARHVNVPSANGRSGSGYDYRFDAVKFVNKVAAVEDAMARSDAPYLVWMDADIFAHGEVTAEWLKPLLPAHGEALSWLDRVDIYPECGLVIFNQRHSGAHRAVREWRRLYESWDVFGLRETHDSFALEHVVKRAGLETRSLSGGARTTSHPFVNGPLGARLDHLKGPRKDYGRSHASDLRAPRPEGYWQR